MFISFLKKGSGLNGTKRVTNLQDGYNKGLTKRSLSRRMLMIIFCINYYHIIVPTRKVLSFHNAQNLSTHHYSWHSNTIIKHNYETLA